MQKLEHYGINGKNLSWFKSYQTNQKQYIQCDSNINNDIKNYDIIIIIIIKTNSNFEKTELLDIMCSVPQGSILGPFLFILYINDLVLYQFLKPIIFADDTNSFCSNKEIKLLFLKANLELGKISECFRANKLSLNEDKTKFMLFHRPQDRDNLPL